MGSNLGYLLKSSLLYVGMQFTFSKSKDIQYIHDIAQCTAMKP